MMKRLFISVFCVVAAGLSAVNAGALEPRIMSLHDCMEYAVSNSTKMRIQEAAVGDARIARREAVLATFLPTLSTGTGASYSFGRNIDPETNTYINTVSFSNSYSVSAGITLFNGFSAVNNMKISQTSLKMGETQEKQIEADICLAVMEAYYNVVYYKRLADVYKEQIATAEMSLAKARRQEELGQKGHADVIQMEADLADRQYDLTATVNMYRDQKTALADLMFWPPEEELVIETEGGFFAGAQNDISPITLRELHPERSEGSAIEESIVNFALSHDPQVRIAEWSVQNARRELSTAKWQTLPSVSLSGGWSTSYYNFMGAQRTPFWDLLSRNGGEYVSLSVSIPIFNRLSRRSNIARKRNALVKAEAEYDQTLRDVEREVRRAMQDRDGAATAWLQAQRRAEVQDEAYALNMKKLEQGLISPLEFQTAGNNYLRAQADEMNSLFSYLIKQAVVQYYNGIDYIEQ